MLTTLSDVWHIVARILVNWYGYFGKKFIYLLRISRQYLSTKLYLRTLNNKDNANSDSDLPAMTQKYETLKIKEMLVLPFHLAIQITPLLPWF